ncbi:DEAD/DEAH box helicase [Marininema halotolerans]|uniref:DEAD-box ATP-dependent RNA helicase CshA n=1 Tax=Marininema halotolerans TaxID=1155944 RepID=A0A1I6NUA9_9BACL|nr:DEAD/DEAH box helicase [Marininema halotolerans]SFS31460.1 ATP-dependent RNA helicase DeaD [Marininema halotolerans]
MTTFHELGLDPRVIQSLSNMGFEEATPIQAEALPVGLSGNDLIGQAQTGTGKTAAFGIPLIEKADPSLDSIQGIVITPTRELAVQVAEELNKIGQHKGIRTLPVYGGQDIERQIRSLKKRPQLIAGTPGRLLDHLRRRTIRTDQVVMTVLDEADEMLNMGFIEDIEAILAQFPDERQTLLFSATMPEQIRQLAVRFMNNPQTIRVKAKEMTMPRIRQQFLEVPQRHKFDILCRLLDIQSPELAIIFGRTKKRVDELAEGLNKRGYSAEGIHGDLTQARRDTVMRQFRDGMIDILVATDVAARGLDISGVTHVYNFDIPQDPESYVHRIGRTGRAGNDGLAITFITSREIGHLRTIERLTKKRMERLPIPSMDAAMEGQQRLAMDKLSGLVKEGGYQPYKTLAEELLEETDSVTLLSAALKLLTKEPDTTPVRITEDSGSSFGKKGGGGGRFRKGGGGGGGGYKRPRSSGHKGGHHSGNRRRQHRSQ